MVGEVFNLPLVSECVDFARYLIRRHFPAAGATAASGGGGATRAGRDSLRRLRLFTRRRATSYQARGFERPRV